jgi:hypothetical protein
MLLQSALRVNTLFPDLPSIRYSPLLLSDWTGVPLSGTCEYSSSFDPCRKWLDLIWNGYQANMFSAVFAPPFSGWNTLGYGTIYASSSRSVRPKDEQIIVFVLAHDETLHP